MDPSSLVESSFASSSVSGDTAGIGGNLSTDSTTGSVSSSGIPKDAAVDTCSLYDIQALVLTEALMSMLTTLLAIVTFLFTCFSITMDVQILVVEPIERMTRVVRKMASQIHFLSASDIEGYVDHHIPTEQNSYRYPDIFGFAYFFIVRGCLCVFELPLSISRVFFSSYDTTDGSEVNTIESIVERMAVIFNVSRRLSSDPRRSKVAGSY